MSSGSFFPDIPLRSLSAAKYTADEPIVSRLTTSRSETSLRAFEKTAVKDEQRFSDPDRSTKADERSSNLGADMRKAAAQLQDYGYLILQIPTVDSWGFSDSNKKRRALEADAPVWIPTRQAIVALAREQGLEVQCVAEDSAAFHNWTSRFYPSVTLSLDQLPPRGSAQGRRLLQLPRVVAQTVSSTVRQVFRRNQRACFVFQKIPGSRKWPKDLHPQR